MYLEETMKDHKHLCEWKKDSIAEVLDTYRKLVKKPKYVCMKCGRVSNKKKILCRSRPLK